MRSEAAFFDAVDEHAVAHRDIGMQPVGGSAPGDSELLGRAAGPKAWPSAIAAALGDRRRQLMSHRF
eukprot:1920423-Pyramimonas_sp.AAC.1